MTSLTKTITGLGRVIAYHPGLKKITGSTTATIFLCQLIYWTARVAGGNKEKWIYKTSAEIEEETGLTYYEQKTARRILFELGFVQGGRRRLEHTSRYRIVEKAINDAWDALGEKEEQIEEDTEEWGDDEPKKEETPAPVVKKKDAVDAFIESKNFSGYPKVRRMNEITKLIEDILHINATTRTWEPFVEFAYNREKTLKENPEVFLKWMKAQKGYDPLYATPAKFMSMYPLAYVKTDEKPFIKAEPPASPDVKEYAPMPSEVRKRN